MEEVPVDRLGECRWCGAHATRELSALVTWADGPGGGKLEECVRVEFILACEVHFQGVKSRQVSFVGDLEGAEG